MSTAQSDTPRARVLQSLSHDQPTRCPFAWGQGPTPEMSAVLDTELAQRGLSWPILRDAVTDIIRVVPEHSGPPLREGVDMWGIGWSQVGYHGGEYSEMSHFPLSGMETVAEIERYIWPDPGWIDYAGLSNLITSQDPHRLRAIRVSGGNPFEIYCWMTGLEESLTNLLVNPKLVEAALTKITDFFEERLRRLLAASGELIDMIHFADDLGSQTGLLMSRRHYRSVIQPFHRRLVAVVRECAPHAYSMLHTDGAVFDILPDLIDAGIQVLEAVQTNAAGMDPARLKTAYGNDLSFHGAISVQHDLPYGSPSSVASHCRRLIQTLGAGGGYISAPSHAIQYGTPVDNVLSMLHSVLGDAEYKSTIDRATARSTTPT